MPITVTCNACEQRIQIDHTTERCPNCGEQFWVTVRGIPAVLDAEGFGDEMDAEIEARHM